MGRPGGRTLCWRAAFVAPATGGGHRFARRAAAALRPRRIVAALRRHRMLEYLRNRIGPWLTRDRQYHRRVRRQNGCRRRPSFLVQLLQASPPCRLTKDLQHFRGEENEEKE